MYTYVLLRSCVRPFLFLLFFFFNDTATTEIYTLSLHDALPISVRQQLFGAEDPLGKVIRVSDVPCKVIGTLDRKSTRLNSSHMSISYAVFCLKKKKNKTNTKPQKTTTTTIQTHSTTIPIPNSDN